MSIIFVKVFSIFGLTVVFLNVYLISFKIKARACSKKVQDTLVIESQCKCNPNLIIDKLDENLYSFQGKYFIEFISNDSHKNSNTAKRKIFRNPLFTCGIYNELKHGPGQKVLSYSLYGTELSNYFLYLDRLIPNAAKVYPNWTVRVYYDSRILNASQVCHYECKYKQVSFCDINHIPFTTADYLDYNNVFETNSSVVKKYSYMHGMMWRWLPISDSFVDYFASRDVDSTLIQREKDSVDEWLNKRKLFHVMRDHPNHNINILGGLWGYANVLNRSLGYEIARKLVPVNVQLKYNIDLNNYKNLDQLYLQERVWPIAAVNATIHDSYNCKVYGGESFPTQRPTNVNCFVSCFYPCCNENSVSDEIKSNLVMSKCPIQCRPRDKIEWEYC
jgi:hypothetical protein